MCFVPQYGRLAAIWWLLALNHCACLRNARRISQSVKKLWYIYISGTNKIQNLHRLCSPLPPSFLTCIIECVCEEGRIMMDIECDWRLVLGHSYTRRYSVYLLRLVVVMCLFLSMVVWQPFWTCWRLIIARVSEMHVAYHRTHRLWYIYISGTKQKQKAKKTKSRRPTSLHLTCIVVGGEKQGNARVRFLVVCPVFVTILILRICLLYIVIVPQYGRLAAI